MRRACLVLSATPATASRGRRCGPTSSKMVAHDSQAARTDPPSDVAKAFVKNVGAFSNGRQTQQDTLQCANILRMKKARFCRSFLFSGWLTQSRSFLMTVFSRLPSPSSFLMTVLLSGSRSLTTVVRSRSWVSPTVTPAPTGPVVVLLFGGGGGRRRGHW